MKKEIIKTILAAIFAGSMLALLWAVFQLDLDGPPDPEPTEEEKAISSAQLACQGLIEERLHNPGSAEWGVFDDGFYARWPAQLDDDLITVQPRFRAANRFGATVVSSWTCAIRISGGNWSLVKLTEH